MYTVLYYICILKATASKPIGLPPFFSNHYESLNWKISQAAGSMFYLSLGGSRTDLALYFHS